MKLQAPDDMRTMLENLELETGLVCKGVASTISAEDEMHPGLYELEDFFNNRGTSMLWVQLPENLNDEPLVYEVVSVDPPQVALGQSPLSWHCTFCAFV